MKKIRSAWRRISSPANPGFVVVLVLCGLTAVAFVLGFAYQPSGSVPAQIPGPPTLNLTFSSGGPRDLSLYSFLQPDGARLTQLALDATGSFAPGQASTRWTLGIFGFTGRLCQRSAPGAGLVPIRGNPNDYELSGTSSVSGPAGTAFLDVALCWASGAPLVTSGSYVSADLSPVLAPGEQGTVTRSLELSGTSLSSYSVAGGIAPTEISARSWKWTDTLGGEFQSQAPYAIPVIGSSLPGIQRDNSDIFLSGIFFGVAGGAAVSILPAWLDAADRRKARAAEKKEPEKHEVTA